MKLLYQYIPFQILIGVFLSVLLPVGNISFVLCLGISLILLITICFWINNSCVKNYVLLFGIVIFGYIAATVSDYLQNDLNQTSHYSYLNLKESSLDITIDKCLRSTSKIKRYYAKINTIDSEIFSGKILVEVQNKETLALGSRLLCKAKIKKIHKSLSPYDFDYQKYLEQKEVYGKIKIDTYVLNDFGSGWMYTLQNYRTKVLQKLEVSSLSNATTGLMGAMLLGNRENLSREMQESFANAGVVHLIAISGMHIGVLYFLLLYSLGFLKMFTHGVYIHIIVVVMALWAFAVFTGLSSSVVRSVTMFSFIILSKLKNQKGLLLEPIISSMLFLLLCKPNYLLDVGFQLSYSAVISIVVFYPLLTKKIKVQNKVVKYFVDVILVSFIAQIGVLPITLFYFHQIPLQFLMANFIAVSLLPLVLYGGFFTLTTLLSFKKISVVLFLYDLFIQKYIQIITYFSSIDFLIVKNVFIDKTEVVLCYLMLFLIWRLLKKRDFYRWIFLLGCILVVQAHYLLRLHYLISKQELIVYHHYKRLITIKKERKLYVFSEELKDKKIKANFIKNRINTLEKKQEKVFCYRNRNYLIVDNSYAYSKLKVNDLVLIITSNPKVNLERIIRDIQPIKVIFAINNYNNNVVKWKGTCKKLQVPFYDVSQLGAYVLN